MSPKDHGGGAGGRVCLHSYPVLLFVVPPALTSPTAAATTSSCVASSELMKLEGLAPRILLDSQFLRNNRGG